jgi:hypothetical protein
MIEKIKDFFKNSKKRAFQNNSKSRVALYKVLISSLAYKNTIKQAITKRKEKLIKRHNKKNVVKRRLSKPGAKEMPFLEHANEQLLQGENLSGATQGWVSPNEQMLIESGSTSDLAGSLKMALTLLEKLELMKKTVKASMAYPILLLVILFIMIFAFSFNIIPILESISDPDTWEGTQRGLYDFCMFFQYNFQYIIGTMFIISMVIMKTLPIWCGKGRYIADYLFPWSIYKELNAGIFLISLSTLIESGNTPLQALQKLKANSTKYVEYELDKMIMLTNQAINPATAINTGFLGEIGDDIEDIAENGDFEMILKTYGEEAIEQIIESMVKKADNIKLILMVSVVSFLVWGYMTFISISQSVTAAAGV